MKYSSVSYGVTNSITRTPSPGPHLILTSPHFREGWCFSIKPEENTNIWSTTLFLWELWSNCPAQWKQNASKGRLKSSLVLRWRKAGDRTEGLLTQELSSPFYKISFLKNLYLFVLPSYFASNSSSDFTFLCHCSFSSAGSNPPSVSFDFISDSDLESKQWVKNSNLGKCLAQDLAAWLGIRVFHEHRYEGWHCEGESTIA